MLRIYKEEQKLIKHNREITKRKKMGHVTHKFHILFCSKSPNKYLFQSLELRLFNRKSCTVLINCRVTNSLSLRKKSFNNSIVFHRCHRWSNKNLFYHLDVFVIEKSGMWLMRFFQLYSSYLRWKIINRKTTLKFRY